jgi:AcrR family transcriptional regulator
VTAAPAQSTGAERPAPKRVRKNPDTRRAEIVATARQVFAATGYAESGLAEIASAASVSKGLLYHYFPEGRPQLFVSVMHGLVAEFQQRLRQASKMPFSPRTRMEHLLAALFGYFDENPSAYRLLFGDPWVTHDDAVEASASPPGCRSPPRSPLSWPAPPCPPTTWWPPAPASSGSPSPTSS